LLQHQRLFSLLLFYLHPQPRYTPLKIIIYTINDNRPRVNVIAALTNNAIADAFFKHCGSLACAPKSLAWFMHIPEQAEDTAPIARQAIKIQQIAQAGVKQMDNSIYVALSKQLTVFRDLDITANNIANVNTIGFQGERLIFDDFLVKDTSKIDPTLAFARDPISYRDTGDGKMLKTSNTFDLAINGPGYFSVQTPQGVRYTRAGNFTLNPDGFLVTQDGYPALGSGGASIVIPRDARNIDINGGGNIFNDGRPIGQIGIFEFGAPQRLKREGDTLFSTDEAPLAPTTSRVSQGFLEQSNINAVTELVHLLDLQNSVASTAKFVETIYDLERRTSDAYTKQIVT
jgi:flagellar basal-body rod protein FlgF